MPITHISVRGARQHNLRDINVRIPRNTLTVVTGLSGSGKSSLAFDTIYAEGQRRYVETLSAYARQFLDQIERPDVDSIEGLSPAISIEQKTTSRSPRSTVGTITEIYDYLRLLYASVGTPHCPNCGRPIARQTADQIVQRILELGRGERVTVMAPIVRGRKGEFKDLLDQLDQQGFRARVDGEMRDLSEPLALDRRKNHTIEAIVDRILLKTRGRPILSTASSRQDGTKHESAAHRASPPSKSASKQAVAKALQLANGLVLVAVTGGRGAVVLLLHGLPRLRPRRAQAGAAQLLASTPPSAPARSATASARSTTSTPPRSSPTGQSRCSMAVSAPAPRRNTCSSSSSSPPTATRSTSSFPSKICRRKQQHILVYGPPKGEAPRTGFHGILAYLRDTSKRRAATAIAST